MLEEFTSLLRNLSIFKNALTKKKITGLSGCLISVYVRAVLEKHKKVIVITENTDKFGRLLSPLIENLDVVHIEKIPPPSSGDIINLLSNLHSITFAGVCNYIQGIESPANFFSRMIHIQTIPKETTTYPNKPAIFKTSLSSLIEKFIQSGYNRVGTVCEVGEFAIRGGILDIFSQGQINPIRIEFFGDEIISIREFDVYTQRSIRKITSISIPPNNVFSGCFSIIDYLSEDTPVITDIDSLIRENTIHIGNDGYNVGGVPSYVGNITLFREKLKKLRYFKTFITCEPYMQKEITELFPDLIVIPMDLVEGFILNDERIAVFTTEDIFGFHRHRRRRIRTIQGTPIEDLEEIIPGDYVVHADFGIGIYSGIERITIDGIATDCLLLYYRNDDKLFVPISQFKSIEKYIGSEGTLHPRLSKLGGEEWLIKKQQAAEDIEKIMKDLLLLYAERNVRKGYEFSPDTVWQKELEASFYYDETPDQLSVMDEVKKDMETNMSMDRLICGDVGFGKTEIAIRASMKSVMDGKQVAVLVPTTILAVQHLETFKRRLDKFPLKIEQLSSFVTVKRAAAIKREIGNKGIDIIIGTHALLRSKIDWDNLGLLIIDEEHRFGVKDKEKIKIVKKGVDVLSLTATPIPRTLYQSLQGIKNLSQLSTPPQGRLPIMTKVVKWDDDEITRSINLELQRGGQVFFIHNEIKTIREIEKTLLELVPKAKITVAHGRVPKKKLEEKMISFLLKDTDILLTTTIIGSGIDIPNTNTIIINRANRFGLADLHQLRGRVGRGDRQAFCYLITDSNASPTSLKRLNAVAGFTELGAGIRLAMKDLEIRGAGNLLGAKQHGHARNIGYGLYLKLIEETAKILRGERVEKRSDVIIDTRLPAYFPDSYVDSKRKIGLYKRLGRIKTHTALTDFIEELKDRFGSLPKEVKNLMITTEIRMLAERLGISRIKRDGEFIIEWEDASSKKNRINIKTFVNVQRSYNLSIDMKYGKTKIRLNDNIEYLINFLRDISGIK